MIRIEVPVRGVHIYEIDASSPEEAIATLENSREAYSPAPVLEEDTLSDNWHVEEVC